MELSQLPTEMVVSIADLLSARDLTVCSGVSVGWRRAFNLDRIWKNLCSLSPDYFEEDLNKVKPSFEIPLAENGNLEPLCEWRVTFLKEMYLMKNWREGCFSTNEVEINTSTCLYMMDAVDPHQNHWMFICCTTKEGLKLEVWNIKGMPFIHKSTKMCNIFRNINETIQNDIVNFEFHLTNEKLLFIYDNLVTVYDFSFPDYELNFLYNFSFVHTAPFFTPRRITHLPEGTWCDVEVLGNLLFGVAYSTSDKVQNFTPSVHVWDIDSATKVKDHCVFESKGGSLYYALTNNLMLTSGNSQNLVITRTFDGFVEMSSRIRTFNKSKCEYSKFFAQVGGRVIWVAVAEDIVVVCELKSPQERDCVFHFYNTNSVHCILNTHTYNIYDPEKITSFGTKFAFIDLNSNIIVFDILNQQVYASCVQLTRNRIKTITMVNDSLILLESKYRGSVRIFQNILVSSYEVWDFTQQTKPLRLEQCFRSMNQSRFTFVKNFRIPPKLLTVVHPLYQPITVYVNSFW